MITFTIAITPKSKEEQTYIHHAMQEILKSVKEELRNRGNEVDVAERIFINE